MKTTDPLSLPLTAAIEDAAAGWLVRRNAGLTPAEVARLHTWLEADSRHRAAFLAVEAAWSALSFPSKTGNSVAARHQLAALARQRKHHRLTAALVGGGLAAAVAMVFLFSPVRFSPPPAIVVSTVTSRPNVQSLPDGSTVELNADTEIAVEYSTARRAIRLLRGEALFAVQKDPARPFVVTAGAVVVRAVGTAFAVRHAPAAVGVIVTEGRVAVERIAPVAASAEPAGAPIIVAAGGHVEVPADPARAPVVAASILSAPQMAAALAWRGHRVEFTHTTLAEAATLFNRQNRLQIAIADPAVGRIAISGIFWADDPESFVRLVEAGFNVQAHRTSDRVELRGR